MAKRKWAQAQPSFEHAVQIYPAYATAWSELGQAYAEQNRFEDAAKAFQTAAAADPKYIKPAVQMTALDGRRGDWNRELSDAQQALSMHPVNYPFVYYYQAEANYHLGRLNDARRQCEEAIQMDLAEEVPQTRFLLGSILADTGDKAGAIDAFHSYQKIARHGPLSAEAKARIRELEQ